MFVHSFGHGVNRFNGVVDDSIVSNALHFNTNQHIHRVESGISHSTTNQFTITHWLRISGTESFFRSVWSLDDLAESGHAYVSLGFDANSRELDYNGVSGPVTIPLFELEDDIWYFVALVHRGDPVIDPPGRISVYYLKEGDLDLTTVVEDETSWGHADFPDMDHLWFADSGWTGEPLIGDLAHIRVWQTALTASEILAESSSNTPVRITNLITLLPLDDIDNAGVDQSGNGNNFTEVGEPYTLTTGPSFT